MRKLALALAIFCAACSSQPVRVETVTVEKPVPVACVQEIPPEPVVPAIAPDADIEQRAAWVALVIGNWRHYAAQLRAMLLACQEVKP